MIMDLNGLMRSLNTNGMRLARLQGLLARIRLRLELWQIVAVIGLGLALLFAWSWWDVSRRKAQ
jgi:hypothetical protein